MRAPLARTALALPALALPAPESARVQPREPAQAVSAPLTSGPKNLAQPAKMSQEPAPELGLQARASQARALLVESPELPVPAEPAQKALPERIALPASRIAATPSYPRTRRAW